VHLRGHPFAVPLFDHARPAGVIPSTRLTVPFAVIVQITRVPGDRARFGKRDPQIPDGKAGCLESVRHPGSFGQLPERLKADDGASGIGMEDKEIGVVRHDVKESFFIFGQSPADGIVDDLAHDGPVVLMFKLAIVRVHVAPFQAHWPDRRL